MLVVAGAPGELSVPSQRGPRTLVPCRPPTAPPLLLDRRLPAVGAPSWVEPPSWPSPPSPSTSSAVGRRHPSSSATSPVVVPTPHRRVLSTCASPASGGATAARSTR